MQITEQQTDNECGVCVINSLHKHFFRCDRKIEILKEAKLVDKGLSLFNFEILAQKFGIECETYEISFEEYMSKSNNQYDVMLAGDHYTIIRKTKNVVEVYDSKDSLNIYSKEQFSKMFSGIIVFVKKSYFVPPNPPISSEWKQPFDVKTFAVVSLFEIIFMICSIISTKFLATIIDIGMVSQNIKNVFFLTGFFLLLMVCGTLSHYLAKGLAQIKIGKSTLQSLHDIMLKMKNKSNAFYKKSDFATFSSLEYGVMSMCNFSIYEVPIVFTNVILLTTIFILFANINPMFMLVLLVFSAVFLAITFLERKIKIKFIKKGVLSSGNTTKIVSQYQKVEDTSLCDLTNINFVNRYKENVKTNMQLHNNNVFFTNNVNLGLGLLEISFSMIVAYIAVWFSFKNTDVFSISTVIYVASLGTLFCTSFLKCCDFILKYGEYKRFEEMIRRFSELENIHFENRHSLKDVSVICFDKLSIKNGSKVKHESLYDSFDTSFFNHDILINNIPYTEYECFIERIIFVRNDSTIEQQLLLNAFSLKGEVPKKAITAFGLSFSENLDTPLIKILSLLALENRIIFMQDISHLLSKKEKKFVSQNVLPIIKKNNFFCVVSS